MGYYYVCTKLRDGTFLPIETLVKCERCAMRGPDKFCDLIEKTVGDKDYCAWAEPEKE